MASDTLILERLAAVTNLLNEMQANAKRTEEFPEQDPINASSKVRISLAGVSYWVTLQQITELVNSIGFNAISFGSGVVDETAGDNTTIEEITDFINEVGFTVSASLILQLSIVVKKTVNGLACFYVKKYNFRRNNIIGDWGTGSDNGEILENDLLETGEIFLAVIPSDEDDVLFDLGNIGSSTIYDYINATDSTSEPWRELLDDGSVYYFLCLINDSEQLYRYDGTLPKTIGLGETEVFFSDFDLIGTTGGGGGGETEPITFKYEQIKGGAIYQSLTATPSIVLNLNSFFYRYIVTDDDLEITFSNLPAPDYGFPRFIDLVIPATKVLTIPSADEIIGSVVADGTTVNRIELRFVYYPTVGLRIVALINGGGSSTIPNEEEITGTALYNATTTGAVNIPCSTFASWNRILTGNTTFTFTETPASGKSFTRFMNVKSSASETLDFANATYIVGTYANDGNPNFITIELSNYPTVGLEITVFINQE